MTRNAAAVSAGLVALLAVAAASAQTDGERGRGRTAGPAKGGTMTPANQQPLPFANGREFRTLDAYLAYLRDYAAPTDRPWYREVKPGLYRLERGNYRGDAEPRLFTRDELERRFGFRR